MIKKLIWVMAKIFQCIKYDLKSVHTFGLCRSLHRLQTDRITKQIFQKFDLDFLTRHITLYYMCESNSLWYWMFNNLMLLCKILLKLNCELWLLINKIALCLPITEEGRERGGSMSYKKHELYNSFFEWRSSS